jgi:hypoxia up-regulated 1
MRIPFLAFLLLFLSPAIRAAVLAIDYGAEFTKLSLVKPGVPFDVVLDRDSKRKIHSVVGWKRDDRVFGAEGKMAVSGWLIRTARACHCGMQWHVMT